MNAVAPIEADDMPAHLQRYVATVEELQPCTPPDQIRKRCGILYLRDWASRHHARASFEAGTVLSAIGSLSTLHAHRLMSNVELDTLHRSLIALMSVATSLDHHGPHDRFING